MEVLRCLWPEWLYSAFIDFLDKNLFIELGGQFGLVGDMTGLSIPASPFGVHERVPSVPAILICDGFLPFIAPFEPMAEAEELAGNGIDSGAGGGVGSRSGGGMSVPSVREPKLSSGRAGSSNFFVEVELSVEEGSWEVLFMVDMLGSQGCLREPW